MKILMSLATVLLLGSCSDMDNTPELVDRLRAFGVSRSPYYEASTTTTTQTANFVFYLASKSDVEPVYEEVTVPNTHQLQLANLALATPLDTRLSGLTLISISGTADIPLASEMDFNNPDGSATLTFGLKVAQGSDEEWIRGQVSVYPSGNAPSFVTPSFAINSPTEGSSLSGASAELSASLAENGSSESFRISWLVSDGVIENSNRTLTPTWNQFSQGNKTIIATLRGLSSGYFVFATVNITVEQSVE